MTAHSDLIDRTFHALADSNRRAMVAQLSRGPASVSALAQPLAISLPSAMQHIDVLTGCGLVKTTKRGRVRTCTLEPAPLRAVERWVAERREFWESALDGLADVLDTTYGDKSK